MSFLPPQCSELSNNVNCILDLVSELNTNQQDIRVVEASLKKAIAPKFEIVFAGAFSAGKSMLINALLERELGSIPFWKKKGRSRKIEVERVKLKEDLSYKEG